MTVGIQTSGGRNWAFSCPTTDDCPQRAAIGAEIAEQAVWAETVRLVRDIHGRATVEERVADARREEQAAQEQLAPDGAPAERIRG